MKNRIASLFLVFVMMVSLFPSAVARDNRITVQSGGAERFTDVPTSHWAYGYINKVVGSGLFNGKTYNEFEPSNAMTRSQFVMVLARMEGRSDLEGQVTQTVFPDVTATRRAAGPIAWATEEGIVQGFGDGTFKPDSPITRGQFAALIHRYINTKGYTNLNVLSPEPDQFADAASVSSAFTADVEYARTHGLLTGYSDGTVRASNPVTRAAIAAILARFLDLVGESIDPLTNEYYVPFLDYPRPDSGDSGDTTKPADGGTFTDIKLVVNGPTHGETPTLSAKRNGVAVSGDDLQPGDIVTVHYKPDNGYEASVTVRDAKGKRVSVKKTSGDPYSSYFTMPENTPVTVTVTYSRVSSGGGGGGGGGGVPFTYNYYLKVAAKMQTADGADAPEAAGYAHAADMSPAEGGSKPATVEAQTTVVSSSYYSYNSVDVDGYVWFALNAGWKITGVTCYPANGADGVVFNADARQEVTFADGMKVCYYRVSGKGVQVLANATAITVTATVAQDETPQVDKSWTVSVDTANNVGVFTKLVKARTANDEVALTVDGDQSLPAMTAAPYEAYLFVTPQSARYFLPADYVPALDGVGSVTREGDKTAVNAGELAIYKVTVDEAAVTTNVTTKLTVVAEENASQANYYAVNVVGELLSRDPIEGTAANDYSRMVTPESVIEGTDGSITVTAEEKTGFGDYKVVEIALFKVVSGEQAPTLIGSFMAENNELAKDGSFVSCVFDKDTISNFDIDGDPEQTSYRAVVIYEQLPEDTDLVYTVNANFVDKDGANAEGEISLNIGGVKYALDSKDNKTATITMSHADYLAAYPESGLTAAQADEPGYWMLPIYVASAPLGHDNYQFDATMSDNRYVNVSMLGEPAQGDGENLPASETENVDIIPGVNWNVTVKMDTTYTLGYDLTIIGKGSVTVESDDAEGLNATQTNSGETANVSKSVALVGKDEATLKLKVSANSADYTTGAAWDVTYSAGDKEGSGASPTDTFDVPVTAADGVTNIVVEFHEKDRTAVRFEVKVSDGGSVTVKAENKRLVLGQNVTGSNDDELFADATAKLQSNPTASDTLSAGQSRTYYAYADSMITLLPNASRGNKVYAIEVGAKKDAMQTAGFSFKVANGDVAKVQFGVPGNLSFLAQAPFDGVQQVQANSAKYLQSYVENVQNSLTVQGLLYALNDSGNFYKTPSTLAKVFDYYFNGDGTGAQFDTSARKKIADMLEESVSGQLEGNISKVIEDTKNSIDADAAIGDGLNKAFSGAASSVTETLPDGEAKGKILKEAMGDNLNGVSDKDVTVQVTVTPLLTKQVGETFEDNYYLSANLKSALVSYLKDAKVLPLTDATTPKVELTLDVKGYKADGTEDTSVLDTLPTEITISAGATFDTNNLPGLELTLNNEKASQIMANVPVYVTVDTTITVNGQTIQHKSATPTSVDDLGESIAKKVKGAIAEKLGSDTNPGNSVDDMIQSSWESGIKESLDANGTMTVDMGVALDPALLDGIINNMLNAEDGAVDNLVSRVQSLGDGENTKTAIENLYSKFVELEKDENGVLNIYVLTKAGDRQLIGKTDEKGNLVVTLAFDTYSGLDIEALLVDKNDSGAYEKLVDLILDLRSGISADIAAARNGETAASVVSNLIAGQIKKGRGSLTAVKWGADYNSRSNMDNATVEELSKLVANLMMADASNTVSSEWAKFEEKGYRSVSFTFGMSNSKVSALREAIIAKLWPSRASNTIDAGFGMTQEFTSVNSVN